MNEKKHTSDSSYSNQNSKLESQSNFTDPTVNNKFVSDYYSEEDLAKLERNEKELTILDDKKDYKNNNEKDIPYSMDDLENDLENNTASDNDDNGSAISKNANSDVDISVNSDGSDEDYGYTDENESYENDSLSNFSDILDNKDLNKDVESISKKDISFEITEHNGLKLDNFQAEAIHYINEGRSVLVSAPTGNGKTIIADYAIQKAIENNQQVVYTAPVKALSNQKYRDYTRLYGKQKVGLITGDLVINQDAPLRIMTTEILRNILLQDERLNELAYVVIDEVHFLDDEERGTVWEETLIYLPQSVKIIALSATLPNIYEFAEWLSFVRGENVAVVQAHDRVIPLKILLSNRDTGIINKKDFEFSYARVIQRLIKNSQKPTEKSKLNERDTKDRNVSNRYNANRNFDRKTPKIAIRNPNQITTLHRRDRLDFFGEVPKTRHLDLVEMARHRYLPLLYFVFSRRQTESFARELLRRNRQSFLTQQEIDSVKNILNNFEKTNPNVLTPEHISMYTNGLAFHHAGLHVALKSLVEELYEQKLIKVLYCTSTFALGINMPAKTVAFDSLRKFNGVSIVPLTVRQFLQKAGRAGRRGLDNEGYVLLREDFCDYEEDKEYLIRYQSGHHERIDSAFNLSFSSVVNLLHRHTRDEIEKILDKSFLNYCNKKQLLQKREEIKRINSKIEEMYLKKSNGEKIPYDKVKRLKKLVIKMEKTIKEEEGQLYTKFQAKIDYLKSCGYIEDNDQFNPGAKILMNIQISEILVTEMILEGIFEEADEDEIFGILTSLVQELPRTVYLKEPLRGKWLKWRERIRRIKNSETVTRSEELIGLPLTFSAELMPFGYYWANGHSLASLMLLLQSEIDVSGDLVGAFRRAKDLASQIRSAYKSDKFMEEKLSNLITKVSRDEVEVLD